jgi:competence ComEA-like helix-hairpin-helix protein
VIHRALPRSQVASNSASQNSRQAFLALLSAFRSAIARAAFVLLLSLVFMLPAHADKKHPPAHPIDLNTASLKELEQLPGVGPTTAKSIILFRTRGGRFKRVEDLLAIRGISDNRFKKIRPYVTVAAAKPTAPASTSPKPASATPSTPAAAKH